ncbi:TPA: bacteriocin immunity protein [Listeria monocytogenes]|uniref:Bacteriocin immunity protein n=1 Tax=Listeria monocytogenes TaxID=1639 RepID=A0A3T2EM40_LISMN|nr:bacteriocin immunity protein [Listeria monocytogenes]EKM0839577.1 bacteriocin immunity protein [Listeria innocua]EAA0043348.1 bacteriocin immunity protein [Listeria monocytogenes]EAA0055549.1 bacteriocin immunity protein [Listeria monocytogenes]EAA0076330.1 bacteriocin immunity protein [Listeria monocytogenes]EAA0209140.1 bacteriocin immunity protein [Listeria monocytogenes]
MKKVKWYSGGDERGEKAIGLILELLKELNTNSDSQLLQEVLNKYKEELENKGSSVPLVLSRMNLAISHAIRKNGVILSDTQSTILKELTSLSSIRYGYF